MTTAEFQLDESLLSFVDTGLLDLTEESQAGINRARLMQGDPSLEKDKDFNQTVKYLGGIGLSVEGLPEFALQKAEKIITLKNGDWATFRELDVVILATARIRRLTVDIENQNRLACGTNQDGAGAKGWNGIACNQCQYFPKNWTAAGNDKNDACQASVVFLGYIPALEHTAVFTFRKSSYMEATHLLDQIGKLSKDFARRPEIQAKMPGLPRVNTYYFHTTLSASEYQPGSDGNPYQTLKFTKATVPYNWGELLNTPQVIARAKDILGEMTDAWSKLYVGHNPNAVFALPTPDTPVAALTTSERVTVATPALPAAAPAVTAVPAAPAVVAEVTPVTMAPGAIVPAPQTVAPPPVSVIQLDEAPVPLPTSPTPAPVATAPLESF